MGLKVFRLLCTPLISSAAHGWTGLAKHFQLVRVHSSKSRGAGVVWGVQLGVQHLRLTGGITPLELPPSLLLALKLLAGV